MPQMAQVDTELEVSTPLVFRQGHAEAYQVICANCGATTTCSVASDTPRIVCPSCGRRLVLPATVQTTCPYCLAVSEHPHTLAGHCTACHACQQTIGVPPALGRISRRRTRRPRFAGPSSHNRHHHHARPNARHTAERILILGAAAVVTLMSLLLMGLI